LVAAVGGRSMTTLALTLDVELIQVIHDLLVLCLAHREYGRRFRYLNSRTATKIITTLSLWAKLVALCRACWLGGVAGT
jgi:hypothetical protein